jgi:hypothetical protein
MKAIQNFHIVFVFMFFHSILKYLHYYLESHRLINKTKKVLGCNEIDNSRIMMCHIVVCREIIFPLSLVGGLAFITVHMFHNLRFIY